MFLKNVPEVWTIVVRTVFDRSFVIFLILGILTGPPTHPHTPIPGVNVKVPFRGKQICKNMFFLLISYDLYETNWKNVLKWLRRVAFVGGWWVSPTRKSYSFRSCVRASEAACGCGTMLFPWLGCGSTQRTPAHRVVFRPRFLRRHAVVLNHVNSSQTNVISLDRAKFC